jgi:hypothetical protein
MARLSLSIGLECTMEFGDEFCTPPPVRSSGFRHSYFSPTQELGWRVPSRRDPGKLTIDRFHGSPELQQVVENVFRVVKGQIAVGVCLSTGRGHTSTGGSREGDLKIVRWKPFDQHIDDRVANCHTRILTVAPPKRSRD